VCMLLLMLMIMLIKMMMMIIIIVTMMPLLLMTHALPLLGRIVVSGAVVDMRAEVAVINRNVLVQGDQSSLAQMYGGHVMMSTPMTDAVNSMMMVENVEVTRMGQAFRLGRWA